jgi:release factor glutamine methyltransferase
LTSVREALAGARERLHNAAIPDADLEAELLLRHALAEQAEAVPPLPVSRASFFQHQPETLQSEAAARFESAIARRLSREPSAYITGHKEFHGLDFLVTPAALIPRPETELLVELAIARLAQPARSLGRLLRVADIGTGCGAIAVFLAHALPRAEIYATDVSGEALALAQCNARHHDVSRRISFRHGDLLVPLACRVDAIIANLPYIPTEVWQHLPLELRTHEPRMALDGGPDGLQAIKALLDLAPRYLEPGGLICLEFGQGQTSALLDYAGAVWPDATAQVHADLAGIERVLMLESRSVAQFRYEIDTLSGSSLHWVET